MLNCSATTGLNHSTESGSVEYNEKRIKNDTSASKVTVNIRPDQNMLEFEQDFTVFQPVKPTAVRANVTEMKYSAVASSVAANTIASSVNTSQPSKPSLISSTPSKVHTNATNVTVAK